MPDGKEAHVDYQTLFEEKIPCKSSDCNNGCPIAKAIEHYRHHIGALSISDSAPVGPVRNYTPGLSRELSVDAITMLDVDGTMFGEGTLHFTGCKDMIDGQPNGHCNAKIVKESNGSGEHFDPNLSQITRDLKYSNA